MVGVKGHRKNPATGKMEQPIGRTIDGTYLFGPAGPSATGPAGNNTSGPSPAMGDGLGQSGDGAGSIGNGIGGQDTGPIDPTTAEGVGTAGRPASADAPAEAETRRRRKSKDRSIDLPNWADVLKFCHAMVAMKVPEMELDDTEAKALAAATAPLLIRYEIPEVPPWAKEWVIFGTVARMIYAPRFAAIILRLRMEKEARMRTVNIDPQPKREPEPEPAQPYEPEGMMRQ
jgi:hypothetical protein